MAFAKLSNEGFKVACDLSLTGGESDFWQTLQTTLEKETCKYLLVFSKTAFTKQGVIDEWEQARSTAKKNQLDDFIYLLKYDEVAFDTRIGTNVMNQFRFDKSWAKGLKDLMFKLNKDLVPRNSRTPHSLNDWLKNKFTTRPGIIPKAEKFFSNWLEIPKIPVKIYIYRYTTEAQAEAIRAEVEDFPVVVHYNFLITFLAELPEVSILNNNVSILPNKKFSIDSDNAFKKYESLEFPIRDDLRRFIVQLLNQGFQFFLLRKGLNVYSLSNTACYYYKKDQLISNRVYFNYEGKRTRKDLVGDYFEGFWHFAVSFQTLLYPRLSFSLKSHLVFSDNGQETWSDKNKMQRARKNKGKSFFNKEWRSLLLAFLSSLSEPDSNEIKFPLSTSFLLSMATETMSFQSSIGYIEPKDKGRLVPLDYSVEDDESDLSNLETQYES